MSLERQSDREAYLEFTRSLLNILHVQGVEYTVLCHTQDMHTIGP